MHRMGENSVVSGWSRGLIILMLSVTLTISGLLTGAVPRAIAAGSTQPTTLTAWGGDLYGEGRVPEPAEPASAVAAGNSHSLSLKSDGTVIGWGMNNYGQADAPAGLSGVVAIAAGGGHSLALKSDGTVTAWGDNEYGQSSAPEGLSEVVAIAAGGDGNQQSYGRGHSLALTSNGSVIAWGDNSRGQATVPEGLSGVTSIAAGGAHNLALKSDGTVIAWGSDMYGQARVPEGLSGVIAISAGAVHSLALKSDGSVVAWGYNGLVQARVPEGLSGVIAISAGGSHSLALKSDGTVVAWGDTSHGIASVPEGLSGVVAIAAGRIHSLALREDGTAVAWGSNVAGEASVPKGVSSVIAIAAGWNHNLALRADGTVTAWGANSSGEAEVPEGLTGAVAVAAGYNQSLALKADGTVAFWGYSIEGQEAVPEGLSGVVAIAAGAYHSLALKADGTVFAWGDDSHGKARVPEGLSEVVAVAGGTSHSLALREDGTVVAWGETAYVPEGLSGVVAIAAGDRHSLALKEDGTVVGWSIYGPGQPTVPEGLMGVTAIAAGYRHSLALRGDGTVVAWGDNGLGQASVPEGLTGVTAIAAGATHSLALSSSVAPSVPLTVSSISTPKGGNAGNLTLTVYGTGFQEGAVVKLVRTGENEIVGVTKNVISTTGGRSTILSTFDLAEKPLGVWDIVVVNIGGASATLPASFTIVSPEAPRVTAEFVGPPFMRVGRPTGVYLVLDNHSPNDVKVTVTLTPTFKSAVIGAGLDGETPSRQVAAESFNPTWWGDPAAWAEVKYEFELHGLAHVAVYCGLVLAGASGALEVGVSLALGAYGMWKVGSMIWQIVRSSDPNELVGPAGYGDQRYVRGQSLLPYTVFFENKPDATAPAQDVVITDQLDPLKVDLDSLVLRGITFGDRTVVPPEGVSEYTTEVDLRPANNLLVRINAGLDKATGLVTWRFTSIDPDTGKPPEDALAGFLPPNVTSPEGEGSVSFTVEPVEGLASGTTISNQARIVFDTNDPIDTPVWTNTLDTTDPASQVGVLPVTLEATAIDVQWSGADTGSGVHDYTIYASEDGAPYTVWLPNTTATSGTFTGSVGHSYRFFSSARDGAGNVESFPVGPDASVQVVAPTPPVIMPTVTGTLGSNSWFTGDVSVAWQVTDAESAISSTRGCDPSSVSTDTDGVTFTCEATSAGGAASQAVTVKRDATKPTVVWDAAGPADQASYPEGQVPPAPTCTDAMSGVAECAVTGHATTVGPHTVSVTATDNAGNTITEARSYTVTAVIDPPVVQFTVVPLYKLDKANKVGSTIPIKIQVLDAGKNVSSADLTVRAVSLTMGAKTIEPVPNPGMSQSDGHFSYDPTLGEGGGYQFNVKTTGLTPGTWTLNFTIGDEQKPHGITFVVRK